MQLLSHAWTEITLNGHLIVGLAEDDPPYETEEEDAAEFKEGQDGGLYGISIPRLGGILTIKLAPNSPSTQWCMQQNEMRKTSMIERQALMTYNGTFADEVQGVSWALDGGAIVMLPSLRIPNMSYEAKFRFERITADVDGGTFNPPLTSDGSNAVGGTGGLIDNPLSIFT